MAYQKETFLVNNMSIMLSEILTLVSEARPIKTSFELSSRLHSKESLSETRVTFPFLQN